MQNHFYFNRCKFFSGSMLKLIAVISMLFDHTALLLMPVIPIFAVPLFSVGEQTITLYYIMRKIGRLAFPLFCFLAAEGFSHTRNFKRYALTLLLFAVISEVPFDLMSSGALFDLSKQNVYFTLFLGVLLLWIFENADNEMLKLPLMLGVVAVIGLVDADYGLRGALLILLMYVLKEQPAVRMILAYPLLSGGLAAWCAFVPIGLYNGKRGFIQSRLLKYSFYVFYPLHILILVMIKKALSP